MRLTNNIMTIAGSIRDTTLFITQYSFFVNCNNDNRKNRTIYIRAIIQVADVRAVNESGDK